MIAHPPVHSRTPRHGVGPTGPSRPSCELVPGRSGGGPGEGREPDGGRGNVQRIPEPGGASAGSQPPHCLQQEEMWPRIKDTSKAAQTVGADAPAPLPTPCRDPRPGSEVASARRYAAAGTHTSHERADVGKGWDFISPVIFFFSFECRHLASYK